MTREEYEKRYREWRCEMNEKRKTLRHNFNYFYKVTEVAFLEGIIDELFEEKENNEKDT